MKRNKQIATFAASIYASRPSMFHRLLLTLSLAGIPFAHAENSNCQPQCTTYVISQLGLGSQPGNAKDWWGAPPRGYRQVSNGSGRPQVGDIMVWQMAPNGHVAVVSGVGSNYVQVNEANWLGTCATSSPQRRLTMSGNYLSGPNATNAPPVGWLTKQSSQGLLPTQNTTTFANSTPPVYNQPNPQPPQPANAASPSNSSTTTWSTANPYSTSTAQTYSNPSPSTTTAQPATPAPTWNTANPYSTPTAQTYNNPTPSTTTAKPVAPPPNSAYAQPAPTWNTASPYSVPAQPTYKPATPSPPPTNKPVTNPQCKWINGQTVCK